jgi:hypothetical protein
MVEEPSYVKELSLNHVCKIELKETKSTEMQDTKRNGVVFCPASKNCSNNFALSFPIASRFFYKINLFNTGGSVVPSFFREVWHNEKEASNREYSFLSIVSCITASSSPDCRITNSRHHECRITTSIYLSNLTVG